MPNTAPNHTSMWHTVKPYLSMCTRSTSKTKTKQKKCAPSAHTPTCTAIVMTSFLIFLQSNNALLGLLQTDTHKIQWRAKIVELSMLNSVLWQGKGVGERVRERDTSSTHWPGNITRYNSTFSFHFDHKHIN